MLSLRVPMSIPDTKCVEISCSDLESGPRDFALDPAIHAAIGQDRLPSDVGGSL